MHHFTGRLLDARVGLVSRLLTPSVAAVVVALVLGHQGLSAAPCVPSHPPDPCLFGPKPLGPMLFHPHHYSNGGDRMTMWNQ